MRPLFGRLGVVVIGQPGASGRRFTSKGKDATRIAFTIRLTSSRKPNKAIVELYNLSDDSIEELERPGSIISLLAGYVDVADELVSGDVRAVVSEWSRNTLITKVTVGDGEIAYLTARFDRSYSTAVSNRTIFTEIAAEMGLGVGFVEEIPERIYSNGLSFYGLARDALERIVADVGFEWSIQRGQLQVLSSNATPISLRAVLLTYETGLLSAKKKKKGLEIQAKLRGQIWPGRRLLIRTPEIEGDFVARTVEHTGDAWDAKSPFGSKIMGRQVA